MFRPARGGSGADQPRRSRFRYCEKKKCAGFRPRGQVRQPGADASPAKGNAPQQSSASTAASSHGEAKRRPRRPKGPGSVAGWVRGWGLGALHPALTTQRPGAHAVPAGEIIFVPRRGGGRDGASAADPPSRPAIRPGGRREIPNIANGCEEFPGRRRGPRPRNACRSGTGWADDLLTNAWQPSWERPRPSHQSQISATVPRQNRDTRRFL
jgi:hypothetical protein